MQEERSGREVVLKASLRVIWLRRRLPGFFAVRSLDFFVIVFFLFDCFCFCFLQFTSVL